MAPSSLLGTGGPCGCRIPTDEDFGTRTIVAKHFGDVDGALGGLASYTELDPPRSARPSLPGACHVDQPVVVVVVEPDCKIGLHVFNAACTVGSLRLRFARAFGPVPLSLTPLEDKQLENAAKRLSSPLLGCPPKRPLGSFDRHAVFAARYLLALTPAGSLGVGNDPVGNEPVGNDPVGNELVGDEPIRGR